MEMRIFDPDGIEGVCLKAKHTLQITKNFLMLRCTSSKKLIESCATSNKNDFLTFTPITQRTTAVVFSWLKVRGS